MPVKLTQGITGFVCGRGVPRQRCYYCGKISTVLCDHPVKDKTCDRACCRAHAENVGDNKDYCLTHAEFDRKKREGADGRA